MYFWNINFSAFASYKRKLNVIDDHNGMVIIMMMITMRMISMTTLMMIALLIMMVVIVMIIFILSVI